MGISRTLNFENLPKNKDFTRTFVNKRKMKKNSLCNFSNKTVEVQTMKNVRQMCP